MHSLYYYSGTAIDFWEGVIPLKTFMAGMTEDAYHKSGVPHIISKAKELFRKPHLWEGDMVVPIHVFALPSIDHYSFLLGVCWKQNNNGTTFIVSPLELPWLSEYQQFIEP